MNTKLEVFLREHGNEDPQRLLLNKGKWPDIDMDLAVHTIEGRKRMAAKVPSWGRTEGLLYPTSLCTEQCSSEDTALYKASVAAGLTEGKPRIADLTGGLGVDSWGFSKIASEVLHNEGNPLLSKCVADNLGLLGVGNVSSSSVFIDEGSISPVLKSFRPDIVFMDPARRSSTGKKVFLIEDCSPDVLSLKDEIFRHCRFIFLKLSPVADISMVTSRLGNVKEVHTVGYGGECKELLVIMDREHDGGWCLNVHDNGNDIQFNPEQEKEAVCRLTASSRPLENRILFEPGKALSKAGMFNSICSRFGIERLGRSTNLYLLEEGQEELIPFGKCFSIRKEMDLDNRNMKECGKSLGWADVSARNIPMTSEVLMRRMCLDPKKGHKEGVVPHVFGVTIEYADAKPERKLLVTEPLRKA